MWGGGPGSNPREWQPTGGVEIKGKGVMETFLWRESAQRRGSGSTQRSSEPTSDVSVPR